MGELDMGMSDFWALSYREFMLKHAAFTRAEDRAEAALIRQALRLGSYNDSTRRQLERAANALRRYPIKAWLNVL